MKHVPEYAVEGGEDEHPLYVIRAKFELTSWNGCYVGKYAAKRGFAYVPVYSHEHKVTSFDVSKFNYLIYQY
jgi:hypothetical protein